MKAGHAQRMKAARICSGCSSDPTRRQHVQCPRRPRSGDRRRLIDPFGERSEVSMTDRRLDSSPRDCSARHQFAFRQRRSATVIRLGRSATRARSSTPTFTE